MKGEKEKDRKALRKRKDSNERLVDTVTAIIETTGVSLATEHEQAKWWANPAAACFGATCVLQVVTLFQAQNSVQLFECFSVLSFCLMGVLKLQSLRISRTKWRSLTLLMRKLDAKHASNKKPEEEYESDDDALDLGIHIEEYTKQFRSTWTSLARLYRSTLVGFALSPIIEYAYARATFGSADYPHILPCWAPLDNYLVGYMAMIMLESVASFYCVVAHLAFDGTAAGVMIFIKGQFLLLRRYCENIGGKGREFNVNRIRDARAMYRIRYSHQTLVALLEIVAEFGKLLQNIMGLYYLEVTLTLCAVAMRLNTEVLSATQMLSLLQYLGATLMQLFLFCYYGEAVQYASTVILGQGPSGTAYWCLSPRVRRNLAMLSIGMSRPSRLRAGPFHSLDLPSFTMIVRAAYSYYAFLRKA